MIFRVSLFLFVSISIGCNNYGLLDKLENPGGSSAQQKLLAFVSSSVSTANFNSYNVGIFTSCAGFTGQGRADCACQVMAMNAGLPMPSSGKYISWTSIVGSDMRCRMQGIYGAPTCATLPAGGPTWSTTTGTMVANGYAGLFSGNLMGMLNVTEAKGIPPATDVWTGTNPDGTIAGTGATATCTDWTGAGNGISGSTLSSNSAWTNNSGLQSCSSSSLPIYCFAQP
jgi:hypothetical protein